MYYTIYKITNKINGKFYIGKHQTTNLDDDYMGSGILLHRAFNKYGMECFSKEILHVFATEEEMNQKEKELVIVSEESYNLCEGGKGGFSYINKLGRNIQKEHIKSSAQKTNQKVQQKRLNDEEYNQRYLRGIKEKSLKGIAAQKEKYPDGVWKNKKHTDETKKLIGEKNSLLQSGNKNSQFGTCWITDGKENKKIKKEELDIYTKLGYYKGRI